MKPLKYLHITVIYKSQCNKKDVKDNFVVKTRQKMYSEVNWEFLIFKGNNVMRLMDCKMKV